MDQCLLKETELRFECNKSLYFWSLLGIFFQIENKAIYSMITVGYGDIKPSYLNDDEKLYAIVTILIASGITGYQLNYIAKLLYYL